jgi:DNA-binding winged helix-turn-helix (wHTH) protein
MKQTSLFGPFRLQHESLELYCRGHRVEAPLRALALLERLVERRGELVSKGDLLRSVWGETHVTASSLTEAMSRLRAVLGDDPARPSYVETLPGRGYRFVAKVRSSDVPFAGRHPRLAAGGGIAAAAGIAAAVGVAIGLGSLATARLAARPAAPLPVVVELAGSGKLIETVELPPLDLHGLAPSPDGRKLAFTVPSRGGGEGRSDIWWFDRDTGALRRISEGGENEEAVWAPDGGSLTWASKRSDNWDILRRPLDPQGGAGPIESIVAGPADEYPEAWSADGTRLVYSRTGPGGDLDLRLLRRQAEGGGWRSESLVATGSEEYLGSLSPDGRWLAYVSNRAGGWRVYVEDLERASGPQVVGPGHDPFWSADGALLYYLSKGRLVAARPELSGGPDAVATRHRLPGLDRIVQARASGRGGFILTLPREG